MDDREILIAPFRKYDDGSIGDNLGTISWDITQRNALLYWPKIAVPNFVDRVWGNRKSTFSPADLEYLLDRQQVTIVDFLTLGSDHNYFGTYVRVTEQYLKAGLGRRRGIVFSQTSTPDDFVTNFLGTDSEVGMAKIALAVKLVDLLPSPPISATFQDIVDYKLQRWPSFQELHNKIDSLSFIFSQSGDFKEGTRLAALELKPVINEIDNYTLEKWPNRLLISLETHLGNFGTNVISGALVGSVFSAPLAGIASGAFSGMVNGIVKEAIVKKGHTDRTKPFAYCFHFGHL